MSDDTQEQDSGEALRARLAGAADDDAVVVVRVVAEHGPSLYGMLGLFPLSECLPTIELLDATGERHRYYRAETRAHYVLYKAAVAGHGENAFDPRQR